jgi:murein DD-endopeptidase MepM/ murein hydrolase activator NlpD
MNEAFNSSYTTETQEHLVINDISLDVLPSDIALFSDNAIYQDVFIRSKGAFAFRSKHSQSKIIITLPIPLIDATLNYSSNELSANTKGIRLINELNNFPFCFIKSKRISAYIGTNIAESSADYMIFGVDELKLVLDLNVKDVLFAEITLIYHDHSNYTKDFSFRYELDTEESTGGIVGNPIDSKLFVSYMNVLQYSKDSYDYTDFLKEAKIDCKNYGKELQFGMINMYYPFIVDSTDQSITLAPDEEYEELSVSRADLVEHDLSSSLLFSANGLDEKATVKPSSNKKTATKLRVIYRGDIELFNGANVVNAIICTRKNAFAKQFIGSHQHPTLQYVGKYPANVSVKSTFNSMNAYGLNIDSVTAAFKTLLSTIDSNNTLIPEANMHNHIRIKSLPTSLLRLNNIMPDQCSITATSDNNNLDHIECTFVETTLKEFLNPQPASIKQLVNTKAKIDSSLVISEYLSILKLAKDFDTKTHARILDQIYSLYASLKSEATTEKYSYKLSQDLTAEERQKYVDNSAKETSAITEGSDNLVTDILVTKFYTGSPDQIAKAANAVEPFINKRLATRSKILSNITVANSKASEDVVYTDRKTNQIVTDLALKDIYAPNGTTEALLDTIVVTLSTMAAAGDSIASKIPTLLSTVNGANGELNDEFLNALTGENYKDLGLDQLFTSENFRTTLTPFFFLACVPHFTKETFITAFNTLSSDMLANIENSLNKKITEESGISESSTLKTRFNNLRELEYNQTSGTLRNNSTSSTIVYTATDISGKIPAFNRYDSLIDKYAKEYNLDPAVIKGLIHQESTFRPQVVSSANAIGLMQVKQNTAADVGMGSANLLDPEQNIKAGTAYLRKLLDSKAARGDIEIALRIYNDGPGNYEKQLTGARASNQEYADKVLGHSNQYRGNTVKVDTNVAATLQVSQTRNNNITVTNNPFIKSPVIAPTPTNSVNPLIAGNVREKFGLTTYIVDSVRDGDTLNVYENRAGENKLITLRIGLIDAPETAKTNVVVKDESGKQYTVNLPAQYYGEQSKLALASLLPKGSTVTVLFGDNDEYGRRVGTVKRSDGVDVGLQLVKGGYAITTAKASQQYIKAERDAKQSGIGQWAEPNKVIPPSTFREGIKKSALDKAKTEAERATLVAGLEVKKEQVQSLKNNYIPLRGSFRISSEFGYRTMKGVQKWHHGIDFACPIGTVVVAAASGVVTNVANISGGGLIVAIKHNAIGFFTTYMHLSQALVKKGDVVKAGQPIAKSGNSGSSTTGAHLHYQVNYQNGNKTYSINPRFTALLSSIPENVTIDSRQFIHPDATKSANERVGDTYSRDVNTKLFEGSAEQSVETFYDLSARDVTDESSVYNEKLLLEKHLERLYYNYNYCMDTAFPVVKAYITIGNEDDELLSGAFIPTAQYFEITGLQNFRMQCNDDTNPVDLVAFTIANPSFIQSTGNLGLTKQFEVDPNRAGSEFEVAFIENKVRLRPGLKLHIRAGYGNDPNKLVNIFNGVITDVSSPVSLTLDVVAEGFGRELLYTEMSPDKPRDIAGYSNGSTGFLISQALLQETVTHFGKGFTDSFRNFTRAINPFAALSTYDGDIRDPEAKALVAPVSFSSFIPPVLKLYDGSVFKQRRFTNIYSADIEGVHDEYETSILRSILDSVNFTRKSSYDYYVYKTTPWQLIKEMEYRHPGTLAKPLVYEDRSTMFYGTKEQLYVARDLNSAYMAAIGTKSFAERLAPNNSDVGQEITKSKLTYEAERIKRLEPATGFHLLTTKTNILSNGLGISNKYATKINSIYTKSISDFADVSEGNEGELVQVDDNLNPWEVREKSLSMNGCNSRYMAWLYGTQELKNECEKMYGGKIVLVGDPTIKAGDYAYIHDNDRNMSGIIKIRECQHTFKFDTGYVTEIVPGQYVECANFVWSLFFLKLGFASKLTALSCELSQAKTMTGSTIAGDLQVYYNYIYNRSSRLRDMSSVVPVLAYTGMTAYLTYATLYGNSSTPFSQMVVNGLNKVGAGISSVKRYDYAGVARVLKFVILGNPTTGGPPSQPGFIRRLLTSSINVVKKPVSLTYKGLTWKYQAAKYVLTHPTLLRFSLRVAGGIGAAARGLLVVAVSNPIGALLTVLGEFLLQVVISKIEETSLTRQPLLFFPLTYQNKPFVAGMTGIVDNTYFEGLALNIKKNLEPIKLALRSTEVRQGDTALGSIAGSLKELLE